MRCFSPLYCVCVRVTGNTPPVLAVDIPNQSAVPGLLFTFTIPTQTFYDPDLNDGLACFADVPRVTVNPDGSTTNYAAALPRWLSFTSSSKSFSGTPAYLDVEDIKIVITCADNFGATVTRGNRHCNDAAKDMG